MLETPDPNKAELIITVDNRTANADIKFRGRPEFHLALLGACTLAQKLIMDVLAKSGSTEQTMEKRPAPPLAINSETPYNQNEKEVTKDQALDYYTSRMMELQKRVKAINKSDNRATFYIPLPSPNV
ncbi:MAG: hypothetical protein V3U02_04575 [Calditrichia bacterium]